MYISQSAVGCLALQLITEAEELKAKELIKKNPSSSLFLMFSLALLFIAQFLCINLFPVALFNHDVSAI